MNFRVPWAAPVRELLAEQLRRFRDSLESLACNLRDRIAASMGEALTTLVRAILGPGEVGRRRPYEPPRRSWEHAPWEEQSPTEDDGWDDDDRDPWSSSGIKPSQPTETPAPSNSRWFWWLAPLVQLWWRLCSPRFRPLVFGAVATGVAANLGPSWAVALVALASSALGLIAMADRAAGEASHLASLIAQ